MGSVFLGVVYESIRKLSHNLLFDGLDSAFMKPGPPCGGPGSLIGHFYSSGLILMDLKYMAFFAESCESLNFTSPTLKSPSMTYV